MPRWVADSLVAVFCFGAWGAIPNALGSVHPAQSQALSSVGILPLLAWLGRSQAFHEGTHLRRGSLWAFLAGVLVALGNLAYYHAVDAVGATSTVVTLTAMYPLATVLLALVILREKPHALQVGGILGSLVAIYLLSVSAEGELAPRWLPFALASIVLWGSSGIAQKLSAVDVSAERSAFFFLLAFLPLAAILLLLVPLQKAPLPRQWLLVTLLGFAYGMGNLGLLAAFRHGGKASIVTPLTGLYPVVTIPLSVILYGDTLSARALAGIVVALASAVALSCERRIRPQTGVAST